MNADKKSAFIRVHLRPNSEDQLERQLNISWAAAHEVSKFTLNMKGSNSRPTVFVALLRGVNVGGNNMISMKSLKESFESLGFANVSTYINSGNIIFQSKETDPRKLERKIEQMLSSDYQLDSKVVLRSLPEMEKLVQALPPNWDSNSSLRFNVIFLRHSIDSEKIMAELSINSEIEEVLYRPGALLWSVEASQATRSKLVKLSSRKIYKEMTVRNLNTTRKLCELMKTTSARIN